jgi:hypothetical protein
MTLHERLTEAVDTILYGAVWRSNSDHADNLLEVLRPELEELERLRGNDYATQHRAAADIPPAWWVTGEHGERERCDCLICVNTRKTGEG